MRREVGREGGGCYGTLDKGQAILAQGIPVHEFVTGFLFCWCQMVEASNSLLLPPEKLRGLWYNVTSTDEKDWKEFPRCISVGDSDAGTNLTSESCIVDLSPLGVQDHAWTGMPQGSGFPIHARIEIRSDEKAEDLEVWSHDVCSGAVYVRIHSAGFAEQGYDAIRRHIAVSLKNRDAASWCLTAETFIAAKANLIKLHFGEADCALAKLVMDKEHLGELKERIQNGAKLDTEIQEVLDTIEERKKEAAADVVFLSAFLRRCYMLSMLNFGTMPLAFALAFYNFTYTIYVGICLKFGLSLIVQYVLLLRLRSWLNNMSGDEVQKYRDVVELEFKKTSEQFLRLPRSNYADLAGDGCHDGHHAEGCRSCGSGLRCCNGRVFMEYAGSAGEGDICAVLGSCASNVMDRRERQSSRSPLTATALCSRFSNQGGHTALLLRARQLGQKSSNLIGHGSCWLPSRGVQWYLRSNRHWRTHAADQGGDELGQSTSGFISHGSNMQLSLQGCC